MCREMSDYPPFYGILCMAFYGQFKGEISGTKGVLNEVE
jgi:hypothetical protein